MKKTYYVSIQGSAETAEQAVRLLDKVFRWRYNVYGVYREFSQYDQTVDVLEIGVQLQADWMESPEIHRLFPEYTIEGIYRGWIRLLNKDDRLDDVIVGDLIEIQRRA